MKSKKELIKMSSSNKKSKTKTIATDSKPNRNQKNGIEKFVKKLPNTAPIIILNQEHVKA